MKAAQKLEEDAKVIPWLAQLLKLSKSTFAFTKDRQLGSSRKRRMSSRFASSAAKCKAVRPLLRSLAKTRGEKNEHLDATFGYGSYPGSQVSDSLLVIHCEHCLLCKPFLHPGLNKILFLLKSPSICLYASDHSLLLHTG